MTLMSELSTVLTAYFKYRLETDGREPFKSLLYFQQAEEWLLDTDARLILKPQRVNFI